MAFMKKGQVANFFLNQKNPYSKKRTIKLTHVGGVLGALTIFVMLLGNYYDNKAKIEREKAEAAQQAAKSTSVSGYQSASMGTSSSGGLSGFSSILPGLGSSRQSSGGGGSQNRASASQIIARGTSSSDALPIGSKLQVKLSGRVESADANSPVTAVLLQNAMSPVGALVIPKGTTLIGQGQIDPGRERLQVRFHTMVWPEGQQFGFSASAMMADGSSGLTGDYSSGQIKRHMGQFFGSFIGGVAQGLKDKTPGGQFGTPLEPGNLKNGALNGVAQASLDYAKSSTEQMNQSNSSITVNDGATFLLYLEKEFHP